MVCRGWPTQIQLLASTLNNSAIKIEGTKIDVRTGHAIALLIHLVMLCISEATQIVMALFYICQ